MHSDSPREISILRQIFQTANSLKTTCQASRSTPLLTPSIPPVKYVLPSPPSISQKLLDLGLDPNLAEKLSCRYTSRSEELRSASQTCLHRACQELARVPRHSTLMPLPQLLNSLIVAHTETYFKALARLEAKAINVVTRFKGSARPPTRKAAGVERKIAFNHEFTPFLQKYFEHNAFPSAADREAMAKKSMMEPRQIEVWFQNHRRRAKSEGKPVRRLGPADPAPFDLCLRSFEENMEPYLIPEPLRQSVDDEVSEAGSDDEEEDDDYDNDEEPEEVDLSDVLNPPAARHAFPKTLIETSVTPATRPTVTIDECVAAFAGLHVFDTTRVLSPPFRNATTTIPPSAPLPALVRGKFTPYPVAPTTALNIIPAPRSRQHPFRSPSPYAQPLTLASASPRRKKLAGPPRRTPKRAVGPHRGASPAASDTSTLRSSSEASSRRSMSPPSRTPSLESRDFPFSPSRTPSFGSGGFSSRSSSASSGPTTPTGSPSALPLDIAADPYHDIFGDLEQYAAAPHYLSGKQQRQPRQYAFEGY
ncbi:hypothetical protein B0H17DRAFT_1035171 [Mycena rosella]|uniref:Homeobox domain-containing protein n=1 Tax=Mycena rosella TaxID=1033263 RepID=A0AAD7GV98_MYCRO|nr:hypothetical protein B0H17DRAFT_1035171 [Mycena rosella]